MIRVEKANAARCLVLRKYNYVFSGKNFTNHDFDGPLLDFYKLLEKAVSLPLEDTHREHPYLSYGTAAKFHF